MSPIPENVVDKQLYAKIKQQIHQELAKKGTRWGIYASSRLVKTYKERGGTYSDDQQYHAKKTQTTQKNKEGLDRWFEEQCINICQSHPPQKIVKCGRKKVQENQDYPVCRPYKRVNRKTPTTYQEMDKHQIQQICRKKNKDPLMILPKFL